MNRFLIFVVIAAALIAGLWYVSDKKFDVSGNSDNASSTAFTVASSTVKIAHSAANASVDIEYPELSFSGVSDSLAGKMNSDIASGTLAYEKDFFSEVESLKGDIAALPPEAPRDSEAFRRYQVFSSASKGTVSVLYSDEQMFPGEAHPIDSFDSVSYDVRSGRAIDMTDIVAAGNEDSLWNTLISALKKKYPTADASLLTPEQLPQFVHFVIEDAGLHAFIDQSTILSRADGPADVVLPWKSLVSALSPRFK